MKYCSKCGLQPEDNFNKGQLYCKGCQSEYAKKNKKWLKPKPQRHYTATMKQFEKMLYYGDKKFDSLKCKHIADLMDYFNIQNGGDGNAFRNVNKGN